MEDGRGGRGGRVRDGRWIDSVCGDSDSGVDSSRGKAQMVGG
jgi:hypothetical protein